MTQNTTTTVFEGVLTAFSDASGSDVLIGDTDIKEFLWKLLNHWQEEESEWSLRLFKGTGPVIRVTVEVIA